MYSLREKQWSKTLTLNPCLEALKEVSMAEQNLKFLSAEYKVHAPRVAPKIEPNLDLRIVEMRNPCPKS